MASQTKDFNGWSKRKQNIHANATRRYYHPREIWWCALGVNIGFEQDGTGTGYQRPVLILKALSRETCLVAPLTTSPKTNTYRIPIGIVDGKPARTIISQVRVIDTKRLINRIGILDKTMFTKIRKSVRAML